MSGNCLNCDKPLPRGVSSSFCSRSCWATYKDVKGMAINPERQATVLIKDSSKNLITSLKSEIDKKDEIIKHQDRLVQDYRSSLEAREKELLKHQAKLKYYEQLVTELREQLGEKPLREFRSSKIIVPSPLPRRANQPSQQTVSSTSHGGMVLSDHPLTPEGELPFSLRPEKKPSILQRLLKKLKN